MGEEVWVEVETGNMVGPTKSGLDELYAYEAEILPELVLASGKKEKVLECDIFSTPHHITGKDSDGADLAYAVMVEGNPVCAGRLVSIVIIDHFPSGSGNVTVLGVGTFGIASWDRKNSGALGNDDHGQICGQAETVAAGGFGGYECGQVWGYFMKDAHPPGVMLNNIIETESPFAPLLSALVE